MSEGWTPLVEAPAPDDERFWAAFGPSFPVVYGFLARRCDKPTAEDLTQEVFLELARRFRRGDDLAGLTTGWLLAVARSRHIDHLRAQDRQERKLRLAWSTAPSRDDDPIATPDAESHDELARATELALNVLSPTERGALLLQHVDGLSVAEVATSLGRTVRATESLLARARRKFRAAFSEVER